jgi:hypothetical protein
VGSLFAFSAMLLAGSRSFVTRKLIVRGQLFGWNAFKLRTGVLADIGVNELLEMLDNDSRIGVLV